MEKEDSSSAVDPLLQRLQDKFTKQRSEQLANRRKRLEKELTAQASRNNALPPAVELLSDETVVAFNDLEALLVSQPDNRRAVEQLRSIRSAVNQELRQALSFMETGYTSAFHTLLSEAQLMKSRHGGEDGVQRTASEGQKASTNTPLLPSLPLSVGSTSPSPAEAGAPTATTTTAPSEARSSLLQQCPTEWRALMKNTVVDEMCYQSSHTAKKLARKLTLPEALSSVTSLFAESLATLLFCEVVRVYLYDENGNLHCCACFPPTAGARGDPMRATYTEIMLAKELHHAVCDEGIAINGSEAQYNMLSKRDVDLIKAEVEASGWESMRSCLVFPILFHEGVGRAGGCGKGLKSAGMIHAVNKVSAAPSQPARFTSDDEVLLSMGARTLGCMLTRYPLHYFTLRMDEALYEATHPNEGPPPLDAHLPHIARDIVEEASLVGMKAMLSPQSIMILRAPVSDVYQTRTHRSRNRKLGNLVTNDSALSSVAFNITAVNELWESGMDDNVLMHKQYRALNEQMISTKTLMRNLLDGLAATRTMRDAEEIARYLQSLELFARSENTELLSEFIANTLLAHSSAARGSTLQHHMAALTTPGPSPAKAAVFSGEVSPSLWSLSLGKQGDAPLTHLHLSQSAPAEDLTRLAGEAKATGEDTDPFLDAAATAELIREHARVNATVASRIHVDGPDGIRAYSSDPASKREQLLFIEAVQQKRVAEQRQQLQAETRRAKEPRYLQGTSMQPTEPGVPPRGPAAPLPASRTKVASSNKRQGPGSSPQPAADFASKRPYKL